MKVKYIYHYVVDRGEVVVDSVIELNLPVIDIGDYNSLKNKIAHENGWSWTYHPDIKIISLTLIHKIEVF